MISVNLWLRQAFILLIFLVRLLCARCCLGGPQATEQNISLLPNLLVIIAIVYWILMQCHASGKHFT